MDILIIDDSSFSRKVISTTLLKHLENAEIHFAKDGEEGVEQYKSIRPDCTFVDLLMPKLNGDEVVRRIKDYDPSAKIVVVSADVQTITKEELQAYGIVDFINKPFNSEKAAEICQKIRSGVHG